MTQNGSITIDMYHDLKKLLKRNCQLRVDDLALVIDLPRENPWFDDPPKQQEEIHGELQMATIQRKYDGGPKLTFEAIRSTMRHL